MTVEHPRRSSLRRLERPQTLAASVSLPLPPETADRKARESLEDGGPRVLSFGRAASPITKWCLLGLAMVSSVIPSNGFMWWSRCQGSHVSGLAITDLFSVTTASGGACCSSDELGLVRRSGWVLLRGCSFVSSI